MALGFLAFKTLKLYSSSCVTRAESDFRSQVSCNRAISMLQSSKYSEICEIFERIDLQLKLKIFKDLIVAQLIFWIEAGVIFYPRYFLQSYWAMGTCRGVTFGLVSNIRNLTFFTIVTLMLI